MTPEFIYTPSVSKAPKDTNSIAGAFNLVDLGAFETEGVYTEVNSNDLFMKILKRAMNEA